MRRDITVRSLWFIPHAITTIEPEPTTHYRGGWTSTLNPITKQQAAAVVAHGQHRARELLSLLEGLGFTVTDDGSELWSPTQMAGEGLNRFDIGHNGRIHTVSCAGLAYGGPVTDFAELGQRFAAMPSDIIDEVITTAAEKGNYTVHLPVRHDHSGKISLTVHDAPRRISAGLVANSRPYFYGWDKRDPLWRIATRRRDSTIDEQTARERERLGFTRGQTWNPHAPLPEGLPRAEAEERIRLYLVGSGVAAATAEFDSQRYGRGWQLTVTGGDPELTALDTLYIADDGRIRIAAG